MHFSMKLGKHFLCVTKIFNREPPQILTFCDLYRQFYAQMLSVLSLFHVYTFHVV